MTRKFALELKKRLKCTACSSKAAPDRKFCPHHLELARQTWHRHVTACRASGRCIECRNKPLKSEQRCASCKKENRDNCKRWWTENAERPKERRRQRIARGLCGSCGLRKHVKGHTDCVVCHPEGYRK